MQVYILGSGNTWLRHMIQLSTGYLTGSDCFSKKFFENGFPGEYLGDGSVGVVKSHEL